MARRFRIVPPRASQEVEWAIAETKRRIRRGDVQAVAVVLVMPGGNVATVFAGHRDGHFHTLNSGISLLRKRFDSEAE